MSDRPASPKMRRWWTDAAPLALADFGICSAKRSRRRVQRASPPETSLPSVHRNLSGNPLDGGKHELAGFRLVPRLSLAGAIATTFRFYFSCLRQLSPIADQHVPYWQPRAAIHFGPTSVGTHLSRLAAALSAHAKPAANALRSSAGPIPTRGATRPHYCRAKSLINCGVAVSKPTTSNMPASCGSAMLKPFDTIPTTISLAGMPVF